jgi:hypothetical protein
MGPGLGFVKCFEKCVQFFETFNNNCIYCCWKCDGFVKFALVCSEKCGKDELKQSNTHLKQSNTHSTFSNNNKAQNGL